MLDDANNDNTQIQNMEGNVYEFGDAEFSFEDPDGEGWEDVGLEDEEGSGNEDMDSEEGM
jgi:hypothetical protein